MSDQPLYRVEPHDRAYLIVGADGAPVAGSNDPLIADRMADSYNRPPEEPSDP